VPNHARKKHAPEFQENALNFSLLFV
jgi:hypothetical protein